MLNRATRLSEDLSPQVRPRSSRWQTDAHPLSRLFSLFAICLLILFVIGLRITDLQVRQSADYRARFERTSEEVEPLPSLDARVVSSDGRVLAQDEMHYQVAMHYRWLEEPADPRWVRLKAVQQLSRTERRDESIIHAAEDEILQKRRGMWRQLAELSGTSQDELQEKRGRIQEKIERMVSRAEETRLHRRTSRFKQAQNEKTQSESNFVNVWDAIVKTLSTAPDRGQLDPIVVREQLDYHMVIPRIDLRRATMIEAHPERYPGLKIIARTRRVYPFGDLAAHVIGYRSPIDEEFLSDRKARFPNGDPLDYRFGDRSGRSGVEKFYESAIHGLRGRRRIYRSHRGEIMRTQNEQEPQVKPDVILTLDTRLQEAAEQLLDDALAGKNSQQPDEEVQPLPIPRGGTLVVMDVHTGALLAAASAPRFNLDRLAQGDRATLDTALADKRSPFLPRITRMTLPPGSIFKTLTAAAALESGAISNQRNFHCQGYLSDPDHHRCYIFRHFGVGHGDITLQAAIAQSCNVYFYTAGRRAGPRAMVDWAARFGFGRPTGIDLPGERGGNLPDLNTGTGRNHRWQMADTLGLAIGQSSLTVSPLQIVRLMAAVANDGELVTPHVVSHRGTALITADGEIATGGQERHEPKPIRGLSSSTLKQIRAGLVHVVQDPSGTGYQNVRLPGVSIAGKTGTAEVGPGKPDHAWFAGFVPAESPKFAFVVVLEHAGSGGKAAGPLARKLVENLVRLDFIKNQLPLAKRSLGNRQ